MDQQELKIVGKGVRKKDAMALLLGKPAYVDDVTPRNCLVVKVLRSPHAHALIEEIDTENAESIPGVAAIFTYKDVPQKRFTMAGQTYPEPSPYDRLILDRRVRFVGDAVAIVAGEDEGAVDRALKRIRVRYQVLQPVLDYHTAKDNMILVHPEEDWRSLCPVGADNRRNLFKVQIDGLVFRDPFNVVSGRLSEGVLLDRELVALDSESRTALQDNADRHFRHCPPPRFLPRRSHP